MVDRSPVWFLNHLVKRKGMFNGKFRILDTVLGTSEKRCPILWMYTDQFGFTRYKSESETRPEKILEAFSNRSILEKEEIGGHYVSEQGFEPISTVNLTNKILDQIIFDDRALQCLPALHVYSSKRFVIRASNGIEKCFIHYRPDYKYNSGDVVEKTLKASSHCLYMTKTLHEVVQTIEKNLGTREKKFKIQEISLMFIEDSRNQLWLMGASAIKCDFVNASLFKQLSPSNTISDLTYLHLTNSSKMSKSDTITINSLKLNRGQACKAACAGNFCNFVLTLNKSSSSENQYEQFLEQVIETKRNKHENESEKIKLALRTDYLLNRRIRQGNEELVHEVPFKYILMGKKILENSNFDSKSKDLVEVKIGKIAESIKMTKELCDKEELKKIAAYSPFHYYDVVRVCNRCYFVYSLFTINFKSFPDIKEKTENKKKVMNKDNLDDLLDDLKEYKSELKHHNYLPFGPYSRKSAIFKVGKKNDPGLLGSDIQAQNYNQRATISLIKSADLEYQNLIHECFPDAQKIGDTRKSGMESYREYIKSLKKGFKNSGQLKYHLKY